MKKTANKLLATIAVLALVLGLLSLPVGAEGIIADETDLSKAELLAISAAATEAITQQEVTSEVVTLDEGTRAGSTTWEFIHKRGTALAWTENRVIWTASSVITSSSGNQRKGGINTFTLGISKVPSLSSNTLHTYDGRTGSVIGVSIGGTYIGYMVEVIDRLRVYASGYASVELNV